MHSNRGVRRKYVLPWCTQYWGLASCRHRTISSSFRFLWLAAPSSSFYVVRAAYNITYDRYFSQSASPFLLKLFSGLPTSCRGVRFSSLLGSVPAFAPVELAFTFFPSSRAVMGLELGLYAHILGSAILSQFARSHRTWRSFVHGSVLSLVSCLPALGADSLGALGGWACIHFFSDYFAVKRW